MRASDHKNIDLWKLNLDVINGRSHGMILWQPRISAWFDDRDFRKEPYPAPFTGMSYQQVYRELGCSDRTYWHYCCFEPHYPASVRQYEVRLDPLRTKHVIETPVGTVTSIMRGNESNKGEFPEKWWVTEEEDLLVFLWLEEHCEWKYNEETYRRGVQNSYALGAPTTILPRVGIQRLLIDLMGTEETFYALADYPDTVEAYFRVLSESHERLIDEVNRSPIQSINFGDNLHYKVLSPELFVRYVLPEYQKRTERLHRAGKFVNAHWDGDTKLLLPYAKETGLDGIEAITPLPQGDVTVAEMKAGLGDELFLLDGIPAILFEDDFPLAQLERTAREVIEAFAPKLILGISDEISSRGNLERVRFVGQIVDDYNASIAKDCPEYVQSLARKEEAE